MDEKLLELSAEVQRLKERVAVLEQKLACYGGSPLHQEAQKQTFFTGDLLHKRTEKLASPKKKFSLKISEEKLAGTWFNRLGILAIMLAMVFFLKWSFDNRLIGELGRVAIGLAIGLTFLGAGEYFQRRKFPIYGQGFSGGGIGILYFSIFSAFIFYHLIEQIPAFILMVLITCAASLLAVRYDSQAIGILGIVGGFATPFLLSTGQSNHLVLFGYVAILDAGVLLVAYFKKWPLFHYLTFMFTYLSYFAGIQSLPYYAMGFDGFSFAYLTLFYLIYLGVSFTRNIRTREPFLWADLSLLLLNAAGFFAFSYDLLMPRAESWIGFWAVFLGLIYLLLGVFIYRRFKDTRKLSLTLLAIAAGFITLAIPLQFEGYWITMAWAAEAVIVLYINLKINPAKSPVSGLLVLAITLVSLLSQPFFIRGDEAWIFLNKGAVAYLAVIGACLLIIGLYRKVAAEGKDSINTKVYFVLQLLVNLLIIQFLTKETGAYYTYLQRMTYEQQDPILQKALLTTLNSKNLVLSLLWGLHATVLVILGFWRQLQGIRWFGLGFLSIVILKVFFVDLANLSTPNRIISFMGLGITLLAVSWLYHRFKHVIFAGKGGHHDEQER